MKKQLLIGLLWILPVFAFSQNTDSLVQKLDSLEAKADTVKQVNKIQPVDYNSTTRITFPVYFTLLWSDMKQQVTAPFRGSRQDYNRLGGLVLATTALSFADKPLQKEAVSIQQNNRTVRNSSAFITKFGATYEVFTMGALGAYGLIFKNEKLKTTTLLATQSFITSVAIESVVKIIAGRQRPGYIDPVTGTKSPKFHGPFYNSDNSFKSFPSGHTTAAFAAATVYAMEYKNKWFVPVISYTAASLVGISRVVENKHWATDVLIGATLGYLCGRQVVNNYHRYATLKTADKKKNTVTFNLQYNGGQITPGLIYTFR